MNSPADVMAFLDEKAVELDQLGKQLEEAHLALGEAEVTWDELEDVALLEIVAEYESQGKKLPGEDVRLALSRKRTGFKPWADLVRAKRKVAGIEKRTRRVETAVSARQSTLKRMEEENKARRFDPQTGEVYGK